MKDMINGWKRVRERIKEEVSVRGSSAADEKIERKEGDRWNGRDKEGQKRHRDAGEKL